MRPSPFAVPSLATALETTAQIAARRTAWTIEPGARVLVLKYFLDDACLDSLYARGCHVTVLARIATATTETSSALVTRIVHGSLTDDETRRCISDEQFDVVVVSEALTHDENPGAILRAALAFLAIDGYVVAMVPNLAHGLAQLEYLAGGRPTTPPDTTRTRHHYSRELLDAIFESNGFAVGHVERIESPIEGSPSERVVTNVSAEVIASLAADPDAVTSQFVALAFPLPAPRIAAFARHVRTLAQRCQLAEQALENTSTALAEKDAALVASQLVVETRETAITALRSQTTELRHAELEKVREFQRQEALTRRQVSSLRADIEAFKRLGPDAKTILGDINALKATVDDYQARMLAVRRSFSWRVTAPIRAMAGRLLGRTGNAVDQE